MVARHQSHSVSNRNLTSAHRHSYRSSLYIRQSHTIHTRQSWTQIDQIIIGFVVHSVSQYIVSQKDGRPTPTYLVSPECQSETAHILFKTS